VEQASKHRVLPSSAPNEGMEPTASSLRCTPAPNCDDPDQGCHNNARYLHTRL